MRQVETIASGFARVSTDGGAEKALVAEFSCKSTGSQTLGEFDEYPARLRVDMGTLGTL